MSERENIVGLFIGKRFCGKTSTFLEVAEKLNKRIICVNDGSHPVYDQWPQLTIEQLPNFRGNKAVIQVNNDVDGISAALLRHQQNAIIVYEDCHKYIPQSINRGGLRNMIIDCRKRNFDVFFMYHTLKFVPPFIASMYNLMFLFKTTDSFTKALLDKYPNDDTIKKIGEKVKKHKNIHHFQTIADYE